MTILVFGKTGQVAREISALANIVALGREDVDLSHPTACAEAIRAHTPSAVINAAAFTAVDGAETHEALALQINGEAPAAMARACAELKIPFVHISTDYVFDGEGSEAFTPVDTVAPLSAYGRSKLAGETGVIAAGGEFAIIRTSWVFSAHGQNFVKTMLRLGRQRETLSIVADQVGGPTPACSIAKACLVVADALKADGGLTGIYHFSGTPEVSWANFAREIFDLANINCEVQDIPTTSYPLPARRPLNSRLNCSSTYEAFGLVRPDWRVALRTVIDSLSIREV